MTRIEIPIPVWKCYVVGYLDCGVNDAIKDFAKHCKLPVPELDEEDPNKQATMLSVEGTKDAAIWFRDKKPAPNIVAHESFHAAYHILRVSGVDDEETLAYLIDYIVLELTRVINPKLYKAKK